MKEPTKAQQERFWKWCGIQYGEGMVSFPSSCGVSEKTVGFHYPDKTFVPYWGTRDGGLPPLDLNNLFKHAPDIVVGVTFRYYPGGCECEVTYITEAGFETEKLWVTNETGDENKSKELSALALFWALWQVMEASK